MIRESTNVAKTYAYEGEYQDRFAYRCQFAYLERSGEMVVGGLEVAPLITNGDRIVYPPDVEGDYASPVEWCMSYEHIQAIHSQIEADVRDANPHGRG